MPSPRFTLAQFFFAATALAVAVIGALLFGFLASSHRAILDSSEHLRAAAAERVEARVQASLGEASDLLEAIERDVTHGSMGTDDPLRVEARLFSAVQNAPHIADVTLTHAVSHGFEPKGAMKLDPKGRWQVSVRARARAARSSRAS